MRKQLTVALAMLGAMHAAQAADETGKMYITPQVGYLWADKDRNVDDDVYYGMGFGVHLSPEWSLELNFGGGNYDFDVGGRELQIRAVGLNALRVFNRAGAVAPFIGAGVGFISDDSDPGDRERSPFAEVGVGLLVDVAKNASDSFVWQLRPEVKARWDFIDTDEHKSFLDYYAGLGLQFAFGEPRRAPAPPPASEPPPPPPAPEPVPPPPADSDGDGVLDPQDQCPGTSRGVAVDAVGCPRKVQDTVTLSGVNFEFNSATLTRDSYAPLDAVAEDLKKYPRLKVELQGHTDSVGSDAYNLKLSQRRADAVRDYLVSRGVSPSQLVARGYGETRPKASNDTAEGRAKNRRVDMQVLENPGDVEVKQE
jgi:OOP family OmpA-OmpF porin